jgi:hypothetical protein
MYTTINSRLNNLMKFFSNLFAKDGKTGNRKIQTHRC